MSNGPDRRISRRRVLVATAGLAGLAGCPGGGSGDDTPTAGDGSGGTDAMDGAADTPTDSGIGGATERETRGTTAGDATPTPGEPATGTPDGSGTGTPGGNATDTPRQGTVTGVDPNAIDGEYPQYQYDAANTGTSETTGPKSTPEAVWRWPADPGENASVTGQALVDSTMYVSRLVGSEGSQARVAAIAGPTGEVRWETDVGEFSGRHRDLAVAHGSVYIGLSQRIYSLDRATGEVQWSVRESGQRPRPVVTGDTVYTYDPGTVYALSPADGSTRWSYSPEVSDELIFVVPPAVRDGQVFVGAENVAALDAEDGSVQWTAQTRGEVSGPLTAGPDRVYAPTGEGETYGFAQSDGAVDWQTSTMSEVFTYDTSPAVAGDTVYLGSDDKLVALARSDASERWAVSESFGPSFGTPIVVDGVVYTQDVATLYAYDAASGDQLWAREPSSGLSTTGSTPPIVAGGYVFYRTGSTQFVALSA